jgi:hypothetical protein
VGRSFFMDGEAVSFSQQSEEMFGPAGGGGGGALRVVVVGDSNGEVFLVLSGKHLPFREGCEEHGASTIVERRRADPLAAVVSEGHQLAQVVSQRGEFGEWEGLTALLSQGERSGANIDGVLKQGGIAVAAL